ncbi:hypothetical protein CP532_6450 [Ophiocordyceps camponoti-leonardi (nom. inval.)]|nr:hypothetical protein CP532_6450 [Ophiocordyceps camponoti-leonardi (nom. inval.)]
MSNYEDIAKQFIEFYYNTFDTDRKSLATLYREQSMLTFESASCSGSNNIVEKLASLPFTKVKHQVATLDAQPSITEGGIFILVTGQLLVDDEQRPMNYTQAFQLARDPSNGQYFVFNDVFKLVYGSSFAFKPRDDLSCSREESYGTGVNSASIMVTERAPPRAPRQETTSVDDDFDITAAVKGWGSPDGQPAGGSSKAAESMSHPKFGHPTKMMSSLKKKADVFIHQKTRPEHHLDTRISGPRPPQYKDRLPPPMPMFASSGVSSSVSSGVKKSDDQVFYTDPAKAHADLKALLEGGMDEDDEKDEAPLDVKSENVGATKKAEENDEKPAVEKKSTVIEKNGVVAGLSVKLLPHQVEGVNWMRGRELGPVKRGRVPKGGLLADDMGLGKTLQTLALMLTNQKPAKGDKGWKKHFEGIAKPTLVVAPLALIRQWEHEMKDKVERTHRLNVLVHHGPQRSKKAGEMAHYDVVITTYQILVSEHGKSSDADDGSKIGCFGLHWWRVVLDEAHTIKNRLTKATKACYALRAEYRWCLSGTPMQNNLDELQSLVRFLRIKPYDNIREWKDDIDTPLKNGKGHIAIRRLHSILRCFMKRRTKEILKDSSALRPGGADGADDNDGETPKTQFRHTERNVVTVSTKLSSAERKFYDRLEERTDRSMEAMMQGQMSYFCAFTMLLRLRQACNHPNLVRGKLARDKDALAVGGGGGSQRKQGTADVDAVADMFAGMGIVDKNCGICGRGLESVDVEAGRENCLPCHEDLELFNNQQTPGRDPKGGRKTQKQKKKKKKDRKDKKGVIKDDTPTKTTSHLHDDDDDEKEDGQTRKHRDRRRRANRNAVIDSDDEDDEQGSWLVPEDQRGDLHLGKAGGEEDENAEGGGESIASEDSDDEEEEEGEEGSKLDSFIVKDDDDDAPLMEEMTRKMAAQRLDSDCGSDSDSSLPSVLEMSQKTTTTTPTTKQERDPKVKSEADSDADSSSSSSSEDSSDLDSDSDSYDDTRPPRPPTMLLASSKMLEVKRLLEAEADEHKFIVFSQFTSMLDLMEPHLEEEGFCFRRYDGSMANDAREESLRLLREDDDVRVLLCSLRCGSLGLNLTAATRVIIFEPFWNPFVEEQAIDRVHRLNQTVDVTVYKLSVRDTVEDRILELQEKKRLLAEHAIEGAGNKGKREGLKLGLNELIDLFRPVGRRTDDDDDDEENRRGGGSYAFGSDQLRDDIAFFCRSRPNPVANKVRKTKESEIYGRRW